MTSLFRFNSKPIEKSELKVSKRSKNIIKANKRKRMESDKEVISRLKFIGRLQKGEKINVKYMFVQPDGLITKFQRTILYQDNRQNTLSFLQNTISRAFEIINSYSCSSKESQIRIGSHVISDLKKSKEGLANLKNTYLSDTKFICDIDTLVQEIDAKLLEVDTEEEEEED
jgi:hypothetical protein